MGAMLPGDTKRLLGGLAGDEALLCLETFRRNERWHILFPHSKYDPSKN